MFGTLLRLQVLAFRRAPYFGGRLALTILKGLGLAYAVVSAALLGFLLPDTLSVALPGVSALAVVERALLPALAMLTVARVLFQDVPTRGSEAFLLMPVSRQRVAATVTVRSLLSVLNAVPLLFVIPFATRTVRAEAGTGAAWEFVLGTVVLVVLSHVVMVVWKTRLGERPLQTVLLIGGLVVALAGLDWMLGGLVSWFRQPAGWGLIGGLTVGAVGLGHHAYRGLEDALYLDHAVRPMWRRPARQAEGTSGFTRPGVWAFVELDGRQLVRSRYPRGIIVNAAVLGMALSCVGLVGQRGEPTTLLMMFAASTVAISAGQFALPFASGHYDRLLTLPDTLPTFVRAKLAMLMGSVLTLGVLQLGLMLALAPSVANALAIGAAVLFGSGVLAPVAILGSSIAPKPLDVDDRVMMNYKIQSFGAQLLIGAVSVAAAGLFLALGEHRGLMALASIGAAGVLALPLWERGLVARLRHRRHAVSARFRTTL